MQIPQHKKCGRCNVIFPSDCFYKNKGRSDGLTSYCKSCHTDSCTQRVKEIRLAAITKLGSHCAHCGYDKDVRALQIDHVNGGGRKEIRAIANSERYYKKVLSDTTGSYQVLCANCNQIKKFDMDEGRYRSGNLQPSSDEDASTVVTRKRGVQPGSTRNLNMSGKLKDFKERNPEAWAERNRKISESRKGNKYPRNNK